MNLVLEKNDIRSTAHVFFFDQNLGCFKPVYNHTLRFVARLFSHLCLGPQRSFLPQDFLNNICYTSTIYSRVLHVLLN